MRGESFEREMGLWGLYMVDKAMKKKQETPNGARGLTKV